MASQERSLALTHSGDAGTSSHLLHREYRTLRPRHLKTWLRIRYANQGALYPKEYPSLVLLVSQISKERNLAEIFWTHQRLLDFQHLRGADRGNVQLIFRNQYRFELKSRFLCPRVRKQHHFLEAGQSLQ